MGKGKSRTRRGKEKDVKGEERGRREGKKGCKVHSPERAYPKGRRWLCCISIYPSWGCLPQETRAALTAQLGRSAEKQPRVSEIANVITK